MPVLSQAFWAGGRATGAVVPPGQLRAPDGGRKYQAGAGPQSCRAPAAHRPPRLGLEMGSYGMRVCLISAEYPPLVGGVADHTRHLARSLALLGVEVAVLTTRSGVSGGIGDPRETSPAVMDEGFQTLAAISRWDFRLFGEVRRALACLRPDI